MNAKEITKNKIDDYRILAFFQVVASSPNSTVVIKRGCKGTTKFCVVPRKSHVFFSFLLLQ